MINQTLNTPFFYFSYTYDLTHSLQRLSAAGSNFYEVGLTILYNLTIVKYGIKMLVILVGHGT